MAEGGNILLVEGESDKDFFDELLKHLGLIVQIKVAPPKEFGGTHNTKQGAFNLLKTMLDSLADGSIGRLGIVVDADLVANGGGLENTLNQIREKISGSGFSISSEKYGTGFAFEHSNGLPDFGVWIMPNNADEGGIELWLANCVHGNSRGLLTHAKSVVASLPKPTKFKTTHLPKAEIATWLAWEKHPGQGFHRVFADQLINENSADFSNLSNWLKHIFPNR